MALCVTDAIVGNLVHIPGQTIHSSFAVLILICLSPDTSSWK